MVTYMKKLVSAIVASAVAASTFVPAFAATLKAHFDETGRKPSYYDLI